VYFTPVETFRALAARPVWLAAFLALIAVNTTFTFVWLRHADPVELSRTQLEEAGVFERGGTPEQHAALVERQAKMFPVFAWLGPTAFGPAAFFLLALLLMFVYRFFYASDTTMRQSLAVVSWTFFAVGLVATPLTLLVLWLKGEWNVDPRTVVQASPAAFVEKGAMAKPLHALLDAFDLFSIWILFLLSAGYAATARRKVGSAAAGVVVLWALYVGMKVALAAIFS
jgi:hypothetical protein